MTNQDAYLDDLNELHSYIQELLALVTDKRKRERAEVVAGSATATIGCMKNDYIIEDR